MSKQNELPPIDFDGRWKQIIEALFEDFILFFLPKIHHLIDFSYPAKFLKQDLPKLAAEKSKKGDLINDNLIEVRLKSGKKQFLYIHIEVHGYENIDFGKKMFRYFYRIFDRYEREITALAILINNRLPQNPSGYHYQFGDTEITYKFPTYMIRDQRRDELLASKNPFAVAILVCLDVDRTRKKLQERLTLKVEIFQLILKRGREQNYDSDTIVQLMHFMINIMLLPKAKEGDFLRISYDNFKTKKDMTQVSETELRIMDQIASIHFNSTVSDLFKKFEREVRRRKAAEKNRKILEAKRKEEETKRKEEEAKRKQEETKRKEEEVKRKEEETKRLAEQTKTILLLHNSFGQTAEQIVHSLGYELSFVQQIIQKPSNNNK